MTTALGRPSNRVDTIATIDRSMREIKSWMDAM